MNLDKTSNLGQKFAALDILLYRKLLPVIAGFIQVQLFLPSLFINNVKSDHQYVVWQTNDPNNKRLSIVMEAMESPGAGYILCLAECLKISAIAISTKGENELKFISNWLET